MTKRPDEEEIRALRILVDAKPISYPPSEFASTRVALEESYPDLAEFELAFAVHQGVPLQKLPLGFGIDTSARVAALREAERRLGLTRSDFHEIVKDLLPRLLAVQLSDPDEIEAAARARIDATIHMIEPALSSRRRAQTSKGREAVQARKQHWMARAAELRAERFSVAQIAQKLSDERGVPTSERTVSRWLEVKKL